MNTCSYGSWFFSYMITPVFVLVTHLSVFNIKKTRGETTENNVLLYATLLCSFALRNSQFKASTSSWRWTVNFMFVHKAVFFYCSTMYSFSHLSALTGVYRFSGAAFPDSPRHPAGGAARLLHAAPLHTQVTQKAQGESENRLRKSVSCVLQ